MAVSDSVGGDVHNGVRYLLKSVVVAVRRELGHNGRKTEVLVLFTENIRIRENHHEREHEAHDPQAEGAALVPTQTYDNEAKEYGPKIEPVEAYGIVYRKVEHEQENEDGEVTNPLPPLCQ